MSHSATRKAGLRYNRKQAGPRVVYSFAKSVLLPSICVFYLVVLLKLYTWGFSFLSPSTAVNLPCDLPGCSRPVYPDSAMKPLPNGNPGLANTVPSFLEELHPARPVQHGSLTAVLPVTASTISDLESKLLVLHKESVHLSEVIIVCPEGIFSVVRRILHDVVSVTLGNSQVEVILQPWPWGVGEIEVLARATSQATSEFILIMNDFEWMEVADSGARRKILNPLNMSFPFGIRGYSSPQFTCLFPSQNPQSASFLVPPFVFPSNLLLPDEGDHRPQLQTWLAFGERLFHSRAGMVGGVVLASEDPQVVDPWCQDSQPIQDESSPVPVKQNVLEENLLRQQFLENDTTTTSRGTFGLLLPTLGDLQAFSSPACRLVSEGHRLHILLYGAQERQSGANHLHGMDNILDDEVLVKGDCNLHYQIQRPRDVSIAVKLTSWLDTFHRSPEVLIALADQDASTDHLSQIVRRKEYIKTKLIQIPRLDLLYCDWMGTLTIQEWKNWHTPKIDISIITNDRPHSLSRLLTSLSKARYFGDKLTIRVNAEQTADKGTLQLVQNIQWDHGAVFLHHRVVRGGLLPAVVESWYPLSNDTYGLLLEDDVEVSPLFYAWLKMSLLRYRYGQETNKKPFLFGISLYQQKSVELRPEGRRPFNARQLFASSGISQSSTPYLSQIPCSWGALYFPEHWRQFHAYLSARLSQPPVLPFSLKDSIIPDVRSNKWTHSWKKYFIELVYLRGYVMLYPNYADFTSLSTNHLEVGSHVKNMPRDVYSKKKSLFSLPLMQLPDSNISFSPETTLLRLPDGQLPAWSALPVLDLHGHLISGDELQRRGRDKRSSLFDCFASASEHPAYDLLCSGP